MRHVRGFSLVEVMVVIAIIGIMTGVAFVSLSGKRDEESLKVAAREVAAAIRTAQNNALSGVKKSGNDNGLCSHKAKWEGSGTYGTYVTHLKNGGSRFCANSNDKDSFLIDTYTLSPGVVFDSPSPGWEVAFTVPHGDIDTAGGPVKTIALTKNDKHVAVCVLASGVVIEKPVGTSTCP